MKLCEQFLNGLHELGFGELVVSSLEEARSNSRARNIVVRPSLYNPEFSEIFVTHHYRGHFEVFIDGILSSGKLVEVLLKSIDKIYSYPDSFLGQQHSVSFDSEEKLALINDVSELPKNVIPVDFSTKTKKDFND